VTIDNLKRFNTPQDVDNIIIPPCHNIVCIGFHESQTPLTLMKFIKKITDFYNIKCIPYKNIVNDESNGIDLIFYMLIFFV
jgi:hypothetical protein